MLEERRIIPRYQADFIVDIEFRPELNAASFINNSGKVVNISLGGVYLLVNEKMKKGVPLSLNFKIAGMSNTNEKNLYKTTGQVLRSGSITEETPETRNRYHFQEIKGKYFCAVQFSEVQFELSEKLSKCKQVL